MAFRLIKLLALILVVGVVLWTSHYNPSQMEIFYKSGASLKASVGLILLCSFLAGAATMLILAAFVGIQLQLRNWRTSKQKELAEDHHALIDKARGQLILGNFERARVLFSKVISKYSSDIGARALLAKAILGEGKPKEALKVIDEARSEDKENTELLLMASDVNAQLGNHAAAYDNAATVLKLVPKNTFALKKLVSECIPLARFDEAIDYQRQVIKLAAPKDVEDYQLQLADLELTQALAESKEDGDILKTSLIDILKRHRDFAPALNALAIVEKENGNTKKADKLWRKAFAASGDSVYLTELAANWIAAENPEKGIASIKAAVSDLSKNGNFNTSAQLFLIKALLHLGHWDEARHEFEAVNQQEYKDRNLKKDLAIIKARFLEKDGETESAYLELLSLLETDPFFNSTKSKDNGSERSNDGYQGSEGDALRQQEVNSQNL